VTAERTIANRFRGTASEARLPRIEETAVQNTRTFLTVPEAAEMLRVDASTLYRAIRADEFPAVRIRARYLIPCKVIDQLIDDAVASADTSVAVAALRRPA
jgi:excisionase family DNA binding protein